MSEKPLRAPAEQPVHSDEPTFPRYEGPALLSQGFRPFFLSGALFAGLSVPMWIVVVAGFTGVDFLYPPRDWHVHEMLFGFLPAVIAGFLLTAIPNWTGRAPLRGVPLLLLWILWLAGRILLAGASPNAMTAAIVDAAFLVALATFTWREIAAGGSLGQAPIGVVITLYAAANIVFHLLALRGEATDLAERMALSFIMLLLTMIGGRVTPNFTRELLLQERSTVLPASFSRFDVVSVGLVALAGLVWMVEPESLAAGGTLLAAGLANIVRLLRWRGWLAWREPLVWILHVGYLWLALSLWALGGAVLGIGLPMANAVHVLTAGAVGSMTLGVMTRATLGHTGRTRHAGSITVAMYALVNGGALLRVLVPETPASLMLAVLGWSGAAWSGAYVLFVLFYGRFLFRPSLDE
jgi:uncharacterized protein involved in response to NO